MPVRKTLFLENHYYHIFNRGVENRIIFMDETDYTNFLDILAYYLTTTDQPPKGAMSRTGLANVGLFKSEITLVAYSLSPHHYHLILHQQQKDSITRFMSRVGTAYSMNFNQRYNRVGSLFQGRFKAKHLDTFDYLLESTKYLHRDPHERNNHIPVEQLAAYPYSSFKAYINKEKPEHPLGHPVDQVIASDDVRHHCYNTHPGSSYQDYVLSPIYPEWFPPLLDWLR